MRDGIFLARGKHLHGRIISLRVEVWAHRTSLYPTLFIEMPVPCKECERSCIGVLQISILPLSTILIFDLETNTNSNIKIVERRKIDTHNRQLQGKRRDEETEMPM
jgi:hypothetical protein